MSDSTSTIRLWFVSDTDKARLYSRVPPERNPQREDMLWIPLSVIEHTTRRQNEHMVTIPEWFVQARGL
jgi:hypothetical protein